MDLNNDRLTVNQYYMMLAFATSLRSTCPKARVGAIIVDGQKIISSGYNGSPRGFPHCSDVGCFIVDEKCIRCVHAEINAILKANSVNGTELYTTHMPCYECIKCIINSMITRVFYHVEYVDHNSKYYDVSQKQFLEWSGIFVKKIVFDYNILQKITQMPSGVNGDI